MKTIIAVSVAFNIAIMVLVWEELKIKDREIERLQRNAQGCMRNFWGPKQDVYHDMARKEPNETTKQRSNPISGGTGGAGANDYRKCDLDPSTDCGVGKGMQCGADGCHIYLKLQFDADEQTDMS